jgi:subtilase family serine protease
MKRALITAFAFMIGTCLGLPPAGSAGQPQGRKPDLVVRAFGLRSWGTCKLGSIVFTFQVTVSNVGTAASPAVRVQARDHDGARWSNSVLVGPLAPGRSQTVSIPIVYLRVDPAHMTAAAPHPFKAVVDPSRLVDESNEENNESAVINVGAPRGCG